MTFRHQMNFVSTGGHLPVIHKCMLLLHLIGTAGSVGDAADRGLLGVLDLDLLLQLPDGPAETAEQLGCDAMCRVS